MTDKDYWDCFVKSGRVEDYLKYVEFSNMTSTEKANASYNKGNRYQGANCNGE